MIGDYTCFISVEFYQDFVLLSHTQFIAALHLIFYNSILNNWWNLKNKKANFISEHPIPSVIQLKRKITGSVQSWDINWVIDGLS